MKSRSFLAASLAFFLFGTANAYTLSSDDQARVDGAIQKVESAITKKGESYRPRVISQLQGYLLRAKNNERITAMLQGVIDKIQKTETPSSQASVSIPTISSGSKGYITPLTTEIDPILRPLTFGLIYGCKLELALLKESGDTEAYMKRAKEFEALFDKSAKVETEEFTKKLDTEFHTELVEMLDGKIDPNNSDHYAEILASGMFKRTQKQLSLLRTPSEKQYYLLAQIKQVQTSYNKATKDSTITGKINTKTFKSLLEYLQKALESSKNSK